MNARFFVIVLVLVGSVVAGDCSSYVRVGSCKTANCSGPEESLQRCCEMCC
ncbi:hypothetical protein HOM50_03935 [bacterium]|nr:hypothetical protein [bacterium]MBT5015529.1 hypothetical protein [bacterium]